MFLRPLHATLLLVFALTLGACSQMQTVQEEGLEAVQNLQTEAERIQSEVDTKVNEWNSLVDSVKQTKEDFQELTDKVSK